MPDHLDTRFAEAWSHECRPAVVVRVFPCVRYVCPDCATGWIWRQFRPDVLGYWERESRQERRQRLGLRWWQRG